MTRLRLFLDNLSLQQTLALALLIGLALPVGIAGWMTPQQRAVEALSIQRWDPLVMLSLVQLLIGLLIVLALLRYKVLDPLQRLVQQSKALAEGALDRSVDWQRRDELGVLGRSFEQMRCAFCRLVADLEQHNRDLQARETELANQASLLRALIDHMTDGVTLVDKNLCLVAWNDRFSDLLELPRERVRQGVALKELIDYSLMQGHFGPADRETVQARILASFQPDQPSLIRLDLAGGKRIDVRRRPMPDGGFVSTFTDVTEEAQARRKAEQTRHLLEAVMNAVPALIHVKDCRLRYQMVNWQFLQFWGLADQDVLGRTGPELVTDELIHRCEKLDRQVLETGKALPFYEVTTGDALEPKTLWATKVPLLDSDGRLTHIVTVGLDISERKKAEQEHQRWLQLFQDAMESTRNGFAVYDASHRLVICNSAFASLYGVRPEDLVGTAAMDIRTRALPMIQTIDGRAPGTMAQALKRFRSADSEPVEIQLKDGRWMLTYWHPTAEGGVVFVRTDITHLKKMEQALRESEQRFRSIAEAHPVPVMISALHEERLLYVSPGLANLLEAPTADITAGSPRMLFVDPSDCWDKLRTVLLEKGSVDGYECQMLKADGSAFPVAITARRITYLDTEAAVGGIIDLTERKRAEQEIARQREALHQSEKLNALGSLLAGVAHELNNPLSVVVGRSIMLEETAADPKTRTKIKKIRLAAERCAKIVKTFLAIARQQPPERAPVQLNSLIESAVELLGYALRTADIDITLDLDPRLPEVLADSDQLAQVFTNLIVNAQQALQGITPPRRLTITSRLEPDAARIAFTDNGPGVPAELRSRIFEPFYTSKPVGVGTGIGLSFSYAVIESHGGQLTLESPEEGGARLSITLPITPTVAPAAQGTEPVSGVVQPQTILIIDDEPEIAELLAELLSREGHRITLAASGNAALKALADSAYELIFSDLKMPDLDGPGLYQRLQEQHPELLERIIFITGDTLGIGASDFLAQTGRPVIEKPFIPQDVLRVVRRVLEQLKRRC